MADVFLSYSSKDRVVAAHVERALSAAGYDVFWDQETPTGRDWNSWIGEKLAIAKVVVVLWSKASVASRNVVHEATIAVEAGKLIPAVTESLKATDFPMGFYTVQGADLRGFAGGEHPGMTKLLEAVKRQLGEREARGPMPGRKFPFVPIAAGVAVLALAGGAAVYALNRPQLAPIEQPSVAFEPLGKTGAAALQGDWHWTGLACGQGPHVTVSDGELTVTMAGTPTYKHAIDKVEGDVVHTIVVEPDSDRGHEYQLTRKGPILSVKDIASGQVDQWEACP